MKKIHKGDTVIINTGKSKNKIGVILQVLDSGNKVLVENANVYKKHVKPDLNKGIEGGIQDINKPIHISNVAIFNTQTKKADKVILRVNQKGKKERYFKSTQELIKS